MQLTINQPQKKIKTKTKKELKNWLKEIEKLQAETEQKLNSAKSNYEFEILHDDKMKYNTIHDVLTIVLGS